MKINISNYKTIHTKNRRKENSTDQIYQNTELIEKQELRVVPLPTSESKNWDLEIGIVQEEHTRLYETPATRRIGRYNNSVVEQQTPVFRRSSQINDSSQIKHQIPQNRLIDYDSKSTQLRPPSSQYPAWHHPPIAWAEPERHMILVLATSHKLGLLTTDCLLKSQLSAKQSMNSNCVFKIINDFNQLHIKVSFGAHYGVKFFIPWFLIDHQKKLHFQVDGCERLPVVIECVTSDAEKKTFQNAWRGQKTFCVDKFFRFLQSRFIEFPFSFRKLLAKSEVLSLSALMS